MIRPRLSRICGRALDTIPRRAGYGIAAVAADAFFFAWPRSAVITRNMAQIVDYTGDRRSPRCLARHSLRNYAYYLADFVRYSRVAVADLDRAILPEDWRRFEALIQSRRGIIMAGMHMGNWDYAGSLMGRYGHPFHVVTDTLRPAWLDRFVQERRRSMGMTPIPVENAARGLLRALRAGETVGLLVDRPSPRDGVPVEFFGRVCHLPGGAAALGLRTGAKVVPATLFRRRDGSYQLAFDFEIEAERTGDAAIDLARLTQRIVAVHENWIAGRPDQWYMFRPMWPVAGSAPQPGLTLVDSTT